MSDSFQFTRSQAFIILILIAMLTASPVYAQGEGKMKESPWKLEGSLRLREEIMNWFEAPERESDSHYAYAGAQLRLRALYSTREIKGLAEIQGAGNFNLPANSVLPPPAGQLGLGATYFVHSLQTGTISVAPRRVQLDLKLCGSSWLRLGRFDFQDGLESLDGDTTLDWIKQNRISERLIGPFGFSQYWRSFDGVQLTADSPRLNFTMMASKPTQGGFEPNFGSSLTDVTVANISLTGKKALLPDSDARLFGMYYRDDRNVPFADNRPQKGPVKGEGGIGITTLGAHFIHKMGDFDLTTWGALQNGSWGRVSHSAWAADGEIGVRFPKLWARPWLRSGIQIYSGDPNPGDGSHNTFFPMVPTIRKYAFFPFYSEMNLHDRFIQLLASPTDRLTTRFDYHDLRLDCSSDLWYQGTGATQNAGNIFGYAGRPSGGNSDIAKVIDITLSYRLSQSTDISFYYGQAWGGEIIRRSYPANLNGSFTFLELNTRF